MKETKNVFIQVVQKPSRKVIIKRGKKAKDYWNYCEEVSCDVWGLLTSIKSISGEPVCLWLPKQYITPGTSEYVQGVEVPADYSGESTDDRIQLGQGKSEDTTGTCRNQGIYRIACSKEDLRGVNMRTKTSYINDELTLMIENDHIHSQKIQDAFYQLEGEYYCKKFYGKFPKAEKIMSNFSKLMPHAFEDGNWDSALLSIAVQIGMSLENHQCTLSFQVPIKLDTLKLGGILTNI